MFFCQGSSPFQTLGSARAIKVPGLSTLPVPDEFPSLASSLGHANCGSHVLIHLLEAHKLLEDILQDVLCSASLAKL